MPARLAVVTTAHQLHGTTRPGRADARRRNAQACPARAAARGGRVAEATRPRPGTAWLRLLRDEQRPRIVEALSPELVVWSSLWPSRPDALVRFDIAPDGNGGTALRWTLLVEEPLPDPSKLGHFRHRLNQLINADLRYSYGQ